MLKSEQTDLINIVEDEAKRATIDGVGTFIFSESHQFKPDWIQKFFGGALPNDIPLFSSIARGTLLVPITCENQTRYFAITFGGGKFLLKDNVIEERFGLKVVLNSANAGSLRSIDKTTLGSVPKQTREQMGREVTASEFGIDIEQDLISSVTAKTNDSILGKTITGKDALTTSARVDITNIVAFLRHCYERYKSTDYKINFGWIDQIAEIKNTAVISQLDEILIQKIQNRDLRKIWMSVPEVINWEDLEGFRYCRQTRGDLHPDIGMDSYLDEMGTPLTDVDTLKKDSVFMFSLANNNVSEHWSAYKCTYAEIEHVEELFVLNNGKWYQVDKSFKNHITRDYETVVASSITLPNCTQADERSYNVAAAATLGAHCMDRDIIYHGGTHGQIEFCDILTLDKKLIHIKRYGNSAPLSHLFFQGIVSGELFARDSEFRVKVNDKLPSAYKLADPRSRPRTDDYEVVYGIISYSNHPLDLPFFSKVSLKNAHQRLEGLGYKVRLNKIKSARV